MSKIKDTAGLRSMLLDAIDDVRNGVISPAIANSVAGLAGQVLKSAALELAAADSKLVDKEFQVEPLQLTATPTIEDSLEALREAAFEFLRNEGSQPFALIVEHLSVSDDLCEKALNHEWFEPVKRSTDREFKIAT